MKLATTAIALMAFGVAVAAARAEVPAIGVVAPLSGESEMLGKQVVAGAQAAAGGARVEIADDRCTAEGGAEAAREFVAAKVRFVVGFLCTESIEAALPILKQAGIPTITPGVRTDSLTDRREKTGWLVYRLAPRADAEGKAIANLLVPLWRDSLFAIIDDGTIYGRDLAETFRAAAENKALKPVFFDTYRPQMENQIGLIGRLRRAGATNVMVGGDRDDVAVMARDAAALGARMTFAGGEVLRSASNGVPLPAGTLMVGLPEWSEIADPAILPKIKQSGILPEGYFLPSYAAMQIALAAASSAGSGSPVLTGPFATALGEIRFDQKGDLVDNPYRLFRFDGSRFVSLESQ
ncbi:branched-chain amino acid ABC transporter substrate-binding protein [Pseudaminobacter sp. 19-2017]|uniref:Branched-chain amino acid ABC transporter substrate-binding protein n=1 Tax=Pseudaminobacter soli (ex Zhang et al. 2022) TaxID=2831468 RepID=A0A942I6M2_9HYPH|nr:branched-chain amino acid ABC transporter substrate-binding protein [Pseudaminobacter soli]MBS3647450.1 branched-chain amino acid ABC transporter substrate-binding protein [Pseudaminobacter soli]